MGVRRKLGQVAYEKYQSTAWPRESCPLRWDQLKPSTRARWEDIAAAVIEEWGGGGA